MNPIIFIFLNNFITTRDTEDIYFIKNKIIIIILLFIINKVIIIPKL